MGRYGEEKSKEEWQQYVEAHFNLLGTASFASSHELKALRTLCHAKKYQRMTKGQERKFHGILRQAIPYLRAAGVNGIAVPEIIKKTIMNEFDKEI